MSDSLRITIPSRRRDDWTFRHITTPEPGVFDGEDGARRRIVYLINNLLIGDEVNLPDGRRVWREQQYRYSVYRNYELEAVCRKNGILPYLLDGDTASVIGAPVTQPAEGKRQKRARAEKLPPQKSRYRCVVFDRKCGTWYAQISMDGRVYKLKHRPTEAQAARDYDNFVIEHGLNRPLNFPHEDAA